MKKKNIILILVLIIINQIAILNRNISMGFTPLLAVAFVFGIACDVVLIYIIFKQNEKEKLRRELEEIAFQSEREQIYYQEMEKQRSEMAKIRHDYNNLITSVLALIHMGKEKEAETMMDELLNRMDEAGGTGHVESNS